MERLPQAPITAEHDTATKTLANPIRDFLDGFINLATMPRSLRSLALGGFATLGIIAVALAISQVPQPVAPSALLAEGQATQTTVVELVVFVIADALGIAAALAGAMQMRWLPRTLVVVLVIALLGAQPVLDWRNGLSFGLTQSISLAVSLAQLVLLAAVLAWSLGISIARRQRARAGFDAAPVTGQDYLASFLVALAIVVVYFGLYVVKWGAWQKADPAGGQTETFSLISDVTFPTAFFPLMGSIFIYWFTTSSLDWTISVASGIATFVRRLAWVLPVFAGGIAITEIVAGLITIGANPLPPLVVTVIFGVSGALAVALGPPARQWAGKVPVSAVVAGVITLFGVVDLPILVAGFLGAAQHFTPALTDSVTGILTTTNTLVAITTGLGLAALGRLRRSGDFAIAGIMVLLVALFAFIALLETTQTNLGIYLPQQPQHLLASLEISAALATLGWMVWLVATRRPLASWPGALTGPFITLVGVQATDWYGQYVQKTSNSSPSGVLATAGLFLVLNVWGLARSGASVTNGDSLAAPRAGRVLLYFGYTLVTAAVFLYATGLRIATTGAPVPAQLTSGDPGLIAILGLYLLCAPLALVTGLVQARRWSAMDAATPEERPFRNAPARLTLAVVVGIGGVLLAGFLIFAFTFLIPLAQTH